MKNLNILGTFEGECADATVTNLNGLDITRPVWECVFASDDYKKAIQNGWYIGFLGHPDDVNCMDFQKACIVMTDGNIDSQGIVHGKFNLIDTPVGRIVKSFIDAGVVFGISVRGAGDIVDNSVEPDTFVFRGFDLVTFPAFPNSIPIFKSVAASTDLDAQNKYKKVCASIRNNLDNIEDISVLNILQSQFAKQSAEYKLIADKKTQLESIVSCESLDISQEQLNAVTHMYIEAAQMNKQLTQNLDNIQNSSEETIHDLRRQIRRMSRISDDAIQASVQSGEEKYNKLLAKNRKLKNNIFANTQYIEQLKCKIDTLSDNNAKLHRKLHDAIYANQQLEKQLDAVTGVNDRLNQKLTQAEDITADAHIKLQTAQAKNAKLQKNILSQKASNLKYIQDKNKNIADQTSQIADLQSQLNETVIVAKRDERRTSDLDEKNRQLKSDLNTATKQLEEYKRAYAELYSSASGVRLNDIQISAATNVQDLQQLISNKANDLNLASDYSSNIDDVDMINLDDDAMVVL